MQLRSRSLRARLLAAALLVIGTAALADAGAEYAAGLAALRAGRRGAPTVEELFALGQRAAQERPGALEGYRPHGDGPPLPDLAFFQRLAGRSGSRLDGKFFDLYRRTYPDAGLPFYRMWRGEGPGCVDFAHRELPTLYRQWQEYRKAYPSHYREETARALGGIEEALLHGRCACGSRDSVLNGLDRLYRKEPKGELAGELQRRIEAIQEGSEEIEERCSGTLTERPAVEPGAREGAPQVAPAAKPGVEPTPAPAPKSEPPSAPSPMPRREAPPAEPVKLQRI